MRTSELNLISLFLFECHAWRLCGQQICFSGRNDIGVAVSTQEDLKKCVAPPFIKGVKQLESFVEVLQNEAIGADITQAKVEQVASKLRPHITEAYNEFSAANGEAEALNKEVTHKADAAVAELSKIEEQSNKIKADVDKLAIE